MISLFPLFILFCSVVGDDSGTSTTTASDRLYADIGIAGQSCKFVRISNERADIYVNVAHIVAIRRTSAPGMEGQTELVTINGSFYTEDAVGVVIERVIEL